jgi:hypothetical protein
MLFATCRERMLSTTFGAMRYRKSVPCCPQAEIARVDLVAANGTAFDAAP